MFAARFESCRMRQLSWVFNETDPVATNAVWGSHQHKRLWFGSADHGERMPESFSNTYGERMPESFSNT
jgi:hypothetical protein